MIGLCACFVTLFFFLNKESSIEEGTQEIKSKERTIKEPEKIIDEKSSNLASLQSEVLSLKVRSLQCLRVFESFSQSKNVSSE